MIESDSTGRFFYITQIDGVPRRKPYAPGYFANASTWIPYDVSQEPEEVQNAAASLWTAEVVDAWKAAHPYVAPVVDPDAALQQSILLNARRQALIAAIRSSTDAQLIAYVNNNVTDLASAKTMLANLALLVAGYIRN